MTLGLSKMELVLRILPFGHVHVCVEGVCSHLCRAPRAPVPQAAQI